MFELGDHSLGEEDEKVKSGKAGIKKKWEQMS